MSTNLIVKICLLATLLAVCSPFQLGTKDIASKFQWPEANYPGYEQIGSDAKNQMFYWWFPSRRSREKDPLVLWLTGGPGCSSELALFVENGPFTVNPKDLTLKTNPYSWNSFANLLYVDNPLGTGFSTVDSDNYVETEEQVASMLYEFMVKFVKKFPEFKGRDFYLFGESYAGHYVPHVSNYIYNKRNPDIAFRGAAIGNGLPNPWVQYSAYAEFSLINKLITFNDYLRMTPAFRSCETMMQYGIKGGREACDALVGEILTGTTGAFDMAGTNSPVQRFNTYDITKPCYGELCYNFTFLDEFLNQDIIREALGVAKGTKWSNCNGTVGDHMAKFDWAKNAAPQLVDLLNNDVKVLMYHGDLDFICNWVGGEKAIDGVEWYGQHTWKQAAWKNKGYGLHRKFRSLEFIKFSNAGHMVPMDQPAHALEMMAEFISSPDY